MNQFCVIGPIVGKPYTSVGGNYTFTNITVRTERPGKDKQPVYSDIPFQIFGDHIQSRGLADGVWVIVTGRIDVREYNGKVYTQVRPTEIQAIGTHSRLVAAKTERPAAQETQQDAERAYTPGVEDDIPF